MTDYTKLPREELIKEIEVWRDRCSGQQLIYVDDLKIYVEQELDKVRKYYEDCAKECIKSAKEYTDKMVPETRKVWGHDFSVHRNEKDNHRIRMECAPEPPSIKSLILKFLENCNLIRIQP